LCPFLILSLLRRVSSFCPWFRFIILIFPPTQTFKYPFTTLLYFCKPINDLSLQAQSNQACNIFNFVVLGFYFFNFLAGFIFPIMYYKVITLSVPCPACPLLEVPSCLIVCRLRSLNAFLPWNPMFYFFYRACCWLICVNATFRQNNHRTCSRRNCSFINSWRLEYSQYTVGFVIYICIFKCSVNL
jgi:hypothetical protein